MDTETSRNSPNVRDFAGLSFGCWRSGDFPTPAAVWFFLADIYRYSQCSFWLLSPPVSILHTTLLTWLYTLWGIQSWPRDQAVARAWQATDSKETETIPLSFLHYLLEFESHLVNFYCVWARLGIETTLSKPSTLVSSTALHESDYMFFLFYDSEWGMENSSRLCI